MIEEAQTAANIGKVESWSFYEEKSEEYKMGLRIFIKMGTDDITHIEF